MGVSGVTHVNPPVQYLLNNFENGTTMYVGTMSDIRAWRIQRFNQTTGVMDYATISNNPTYPLYATAWTNRATLTYNSYPI